MRILMIATASIVAFVVLASLVVDEGEVVHLVTRDAAGRQYESDLWVVDIDGVLYLRASSPDVRWLERLRADPRVSFERSGRTSAYRAVAVVDAQTRERVERAMSEKYGSADVFWKWVTNRGDSVPIRLDPPEDEAVSDGRSSRAFDGPPDGRLLGSR